MAKFVYNNAKNRNTDHKLFRFNYGYCLYVLFKNEIIPQSEFFFINKLT